ncbi:hypothetical protein MPH48_03435 [Lysinibacillus fusiformis]|uniref:hypothetical protein n=1 Tax=Lysinibacillus fusiformis TaxID=28031 RepID=UPI001F4E0B65|nr:hypothetical protein [Lysinibacillus fusiformis]MCK1987151.1 hypothetical protein [Lysinibacillus fusiformis]
MLKKALRTGKFNQKEYVGNVIEIFPGVFLGSIHQVPTNGQAEAFFDHVSGVFTTQEEAEFFVANEWEKKFNN